MFELAKERLCMVPCASQQSPHCGSLSREHAQKWPPTTSHSTLVEISDMYEVKWSGLLHSCLVSWCTFTLLWQCELNNCCGLDGSSLHAAVISKPQWAWSSQPNLQRICQPQATSVPLRAALHRPVAGKVWSLGELFHPPPTIGHLCQHTRHRVSDPTPLSLCSLQPDRTP